MHNTPLTSASRGVIWVAALCSVACSDPLSIPETTQEVVTLGAERLRLLCHPCASDADCGSDSDEFPDLRCLAFGEAASEGDGQPAVCMATCTSDEPACPRGLTCDESLEACVHDIGSGGCPMACFSGRADCDGDPSNGCEAQLSDDVHHCGSCNNDCATPSSTMGVGTCEEGQCQRDCAAPWLRDCDGLESNGCEANLAQSDLTCGACSPCAPNPSSHAPVGCEPVLHLNVTGPALLRESDRVTWVGTTADGAPIVLSGLVISAGDTSDPQAAQSIILALTKPDDAMPFVVADTPLPISAIQDSMVVDMTATWSEETTALGLCVPQLSAGDTGLALHTCVDGAEACGCETGWGFCPIGSSSAGAEVTGDQFLEGCSTPLSTSTNCGGCGVLCAQGDVCDVAAGACVLGVCPENTARCGDDSCSVQLATDRLNCGACDNRCSDVLAHTLPEAETCVSDTAGIRCEVTTESECAPGFGWCGGDVSLGCAIDFMSSDTHCGGCGLACPANASCQAGHCVCSAPAVRCPEDPSEPEFECVFLGSANHCAGCGDKCANEPNVASAICNPTEMRCVALQCETGFLDCSDFGPDSAGCETPVGPTVCGNCYTDCTAIAAALGLDSSLGQCGAAGCETPSQSDCETAQTCCAAPMADCNLNLAEDGCETNLSNDVDHCGSCGVDCAAEIPFAIGTECTGGACTVTSCDITYKPAPDGASCIDACDVACDTPNSKCAMVQGAPTCVCLSGYYDCLSSEGNDGCETPDGPAACGGCKNNCLAQAAQNHVVTDFVGCSDGECLLPSAAECGASCCADNYADCNQDLTVDGCETDLNSADSCGGCQLDCALLMPEATIVSCEQAQCVAIACVDGYEVDEFGNCAPACGDCGANASCSVVEGVASCTCNPGHDDCDQNVPGCESLAAVTSCGSCATNCTTLANVATDGVSCTNGVCMVTECELPFAPAEDFMSCEAGCDDCGINASCDEVNGAAACQCMDGFDDCDDAAGCETDLDSPTSCGSCENDCTADLANVATDGVSCTDGACIVTECVPPFVPADDGLSCVTGCDDCGINASCGEVNGAAGCQCADGFGDCDTAVAGCETDLNDTANCGSCGNDCAADSRHVHKNAETCAGAAVGCALDASDCPGDCCEATWSNCDGDANNGCEKKGGC